MWSSILSDYQDLSDRLSFCVQFIWRHSHALPPLPLSLPLPLSRWFIDIFYQSWKQGSSVLNDSSPISSNESWRHWSKGILTCVRVGVSEWEGKSEIERRGKYGGWRQWLSLRSCNLIKAIHHIWIIRQQHGLHGQSSSVRTYHTHSHSSLIPHITSRYMQFYFLKDSSRGVYRVMFDITNAQVENQHQRQPSQCQTPDIFFLLRFESADSHLAVLPVLHLARYTEIREEKSLLHAFPQDVKKIWVDKHSWLFMH